MKRSRFCLLAVDVLLILLIGLNVTEVVLRTYCIHDIEISIGIAILVMLFTASGLFFKWKETKIP